MSLEKQISEDIKMAMKAKNKEQLEALRAVKAAILVEKTSGTDVELTPEIEVKMVQKLVKQRKDSAELYAKQGRQDLADKELTEVSFLEKYLPAQMSDEALTAAVKDIIDKTGAQGMKDMGKVMGAANKQLAGKAEGKLIAEKVKQLLG